MKISRFFTPARLKRIFFLTVFLIIFLTGYRSYLVFFNNYFTGVHAEKIEQIQNTLTDKENFRFAVAGNINNSIGIFEKKMIPILNESKSAFLVSAGNAVAGGGEDKYQALYSSMEKLNMPYLLTVGENESSIFGSYHFYEHFGPYFYSFIAGNSQFIFLDSTDQSGFPFQQHWLENQLSDPRPVHRFVFISHPIINIDKTDIQDTPFLDTLKSLFSEYQVTAVFSANLPMFDHQQIDKVNYVTTGGAGGLVLNTENSYYHFAEITVNGNAVKISEKKLETAQHRLFKTLESIWFFIQSIFYVSWFNFLLILLIPAAVSIKIYTSVFVDRDYYPDFDIDASPYMGKPLKVAMFTNNFLPFIGGVPVSIDRLKRGLLQLSHSVLIIAPQYSDKSTENSEVVRIFSLMTWGKNKEFRIANIFSPRIKHVLQNFKPDLIHSHHPFWMGWIALIWARRMKLPLVYTYHTRLEHYAHFVPLPGSLFRNLISHSLVRRYANQCDGVIVPTQSAEEYLRIIGVRTDIYVQPTGIDFEKFQQKSEESEENIRKNYNISNEVVLISVSRLSKEKNIDFLINGIARLHKQTSTPFKCLIVGKGNEHDRLQKRIEELSLSKVVYLAGSVMPENMAAYYRIGDLFLFTSRSETQGMVILEAMAAGMPVAAVRSSGIDDVVQNEINGYKTPADLQKWVDQVKALVENKQLRKKLSEQAKAFAKDFSINNFAENTADIYAQVMAAHDSAEKNS